MSYIVVTREGVRTFENIDDAGDYAQAMSLRTGEPAKVFHAETEPLKDFYKKLGNLKLVEGNQPIEHATRDILAALGE